MNQESLFFGVLEHGIHPHLGGLGDNLPSRVMDYTENALVHHGGKNLIECPPGSPPFSTDAYPRE